MMLLLLGTTPDELIPADHLIRCVKPFQEQASAVLSPIFGGWYSAAGRPRPSRAPAQDQPADLPLAGRNTPV
jgi:hypothetical protein